MDGRPAIKAAPPTLVCLSVILLSTCLGQKNICNSGLGAFTLYIVQPYCLLDSFKFDLKTLNDLE